MGFIVLSFHNSGSLMYLQYSMGINSIFGLFRATFQRRISELEVEKTKKPIIHPQERPGLPPNLACPIGVRRTG